MTRPSQKRGERFFVEEAAKLLDKEWRLGLDRESPDFIVTEGSDRFAIEVVEIFAGPQGKRGSDIKKAESATQKAVNALRYKYEEKDETPLTIRFVGDMCDENVAAVIPALSTMKLSSKPFGHQDTIRIDEGKAKLSVFVTRAIQANWFSVNDRVGWVDTNPVEHISKAIQDKAKKVLQYKECTGLDDIRLLVVANRTMNSGKLSLEECPAIDLGGFQVVYFFSYPEAIYALGRPDDKALRQSQRKA